VSCALFLSWCSQLSLPTALAMCDTGSPSRSPSGWSPKKVSNRDVDDFIKKLERRKPSLDAAVSTVSSPSRATRMPFTGDRGFFDESSPTNLAPSHPGSPLSPGFRSADLGDLPREVELREKELRTMRSEAEKFDSQVNKLRQQVREADSRLQQASGVVYTLAQKVHSSTGGRHAVMEASAQHIDSQVGNLRRRLAQKEVQLAEKHEEIQTLSRAVNGGSARIAEQRASLQAYHQGQLDHDSELAEYSGQLQALSRQMNMGDWRDKVTNGLSRQDQESRIVAERRDKEQELQHLDEELSSLMAVTARFEDHAKRHRNEARHIQEKMEGLAQEERLHATAAGLGFEQALEHKKQLVARAKNLEERIQDELSRKATKMREAKKYDAADALVRHHQAQLTALVSCTQEAVRTLQNPCSGRLPDSGAYVDVTHPEFSAAAPPMSMPLHIAHTLMLPA